jgi:tetratricopeptide (TPR) repeat protein
MCRSSIFCFNFFQTPISTIAQKELQNLLCAVRGAIESNDSFAVEFAVYIDKFLYYFGMNSDREYLNRHLQEIENEVGSQNWLSKRRILGEQLLSMVRYTEATEVFKENLTFLGVTASHEKCITLSGLGRCYTSMGQSELAVAYYHLALEVAENLEQTNSMKQEIGNLQGNLAIVLNSIGDYNSAQEALKVALQMHKDVGYLRGEALTKTELGKLALLQNNLTEAVQLYHGALIIFQQLNQPEMEAIIWHNLGIASHKSSQWEYAEQAYRKSALIKEAQGLIGGQSGAANTWTQLASVSVGLGKLNEAEEWYRKAISGFKVTEDKLNASIVLCNFADFLQQFPERLNEAQQLAEEALEILNTFDPAVAKLWKIYAFLANISDKQSDTDKAKFYRHKSRQALANFSDTKIKLRQHAQIIMETVSALQYQNQDKWWIKKQVESLMQVTYQKWTNLVSAVRQILNGQRDEDILCEKLDVIESQIVVAILRGIADPETLKNILN